MSLDTGKYEGHTPAPWKAICGEDYGIEGFILAQPVICPQTGPCREWLPMKNCHLAADAPLLLAEVKDLQKKLDNLREYCHAEGYDIFNWEVKNIEVIE